MNANTLAVVILAYLLLSGILLCFFSSFKPNRIAVNYTAGVVLLLICAGLILSSHMCNAGNPTRIIMIMTILAIAQGLILKPLVLKIVMLISTSILGVGLAYQYIGLVHSNNFVGGQVYISYYDDEFRNGSLGQFISWFDDTSDLTNAVDCGWLSESKLYALRHQAERHNERNGFVLNKEKVWHTAFTDICVVTKVPAYGLWLEEGGKLADVITNVTWKKL